MSASGASLIRQPQRSYKPSFPLSQFVDLIWHTTNSGVPSSYQRVYPNGSMALAIHLKEPTLSFVLDDKLHTIRVPLLAGPYSRPFHIDPSRLTAVIGVLFHPGAARMFFPVPAHELHNVDIALSDILPGETDRLLNDVCSAGTERSQIQVVERYLTQKLKVAAPVPPAVRYAVEQLSREGGVRCIRRIQSDIGLSHTRFIQLFREHVGLTPKLFCRVRRFHAVLGRIEKGITVNWAHLAADCGYFDQSHLIRDFRAFAGITPLEYLRPAPGRLASSAVAG